MKYIFLMLVVASASLSNCAELTERLQSGKRAHEENPALEENQAKRKKLYESETEAAQSIKDLVTRVSKLQDDEKIAFIERYNLIELRDEDGRNLLHIAAEEKYSELIAWLLQIYPKLLLTKVNNGMNVLHIVAYIGERELVQWLLSTYPELLRTTMKQNVNVLHLAVIRKKRELVKWLLATYPELLLTRIGEGSNILHCAALRGDKELIAWLLETYPTLSRLVNDGGFTVFHSACVAKEIETMVLLATFDPSLLTRGDNSSIYPLQCLTVRSTVEKENVRKLDSFLQFFSSNKTTLFKDIALRQNHIVPIIANYETAKMLMLCLQYQIPVGQMDSVIRFYRECFRMVIVEILHVIASVQSQDFDCQKYELEEIFNVCQIEVEKLVMDSNWNMLSEIAEALRAKGIKLLKNLYSKQQITQFVLSKIRKNSQLGAHENYEAMLKLISIEFKLNELVDAEGNTLMHEAFRCNEVPIELVKLLIRLCPEMLLAKNNKDQVPFYLKERLLESFLQKCARKVQKNK